MLTQEQTAIVNLPFHARVFLEGLAGTGKTTAAVERLIHMLDKGIPGDQILVLAPQKALALPYHHALQTSDIPPGTAVSILTLGGLARQMVELFWPVIGPAAGFAKPHRLPLFLNMETAQFHLRRVMGPLLEQGLFDGLSLDRNRLYSQVLDNLNKSAFVGFPHTEIGLRLNDAWLEKVTQRKIYQDAQTCASEFRDYCYAHNLVDFSLAVELFWNHVWNSQELRPYILERYRHLVVENCEEDTPICHDLLKDWLPECDSALVLYDQLAGFRRFLGADPISANQISEYCETRVEFTDSFVTSPKVEETINRIASVMGRGDDPGRLPAAREVIQFESARFYPQMLDWVSDKIHELVQDQGVPPGEIVVLAPYLSDALRFSLVHRLEAIGIPVQTHRPSRSLLEEPAVLCLLTLAAIAHPGWGIVPNKFDVANALVQALDGLDLVRAQLIVDILYPSRKGFPELLPFQEILPEAQERITYLHGERYERLRLWLKAYSTALMDSGSSDSPPDYFFSRLFGEVLSQPGYRFHHQLDHGRLAANLIQSAREFREVIGGMLDEEGESIGKHFVLNVTEGVIAAQFTTGWEQHREQAVLIAPAYTYLLSNRPVTCQFWLTPGAKGWWERLNQPLTHPYVLSRQWQTGQTWRDQDDVAYNEETLYRLVTGLLRRCRSTVYLGFSQMDEQGNEVRGKLVVVLNQVLSGSGEGQGGGA